LQRAENLTDAVGSYVAHLYNLAEEEHSLVLEETILPGPVPRGSVKHLPRYSQEKIK